MNNQLIRYRLAQRILARRKKEAGLSLIELIVVVVIIGSLAAIGWPSYIGQLKRSNYNAASIDALSKAKSCVAAVASGDQPGPCGPTITATAGSGANLQVVSVTVGADGNVTPAPSFSQ